MKCVVMVSTMHSSNAVDLEDNEKPQPIVDYNMTKCPVDRIDQIVNSFLHEPEKNTSMAHDDFLQHSGYRVYKWIYYVALAKPQLE